MSWCNVRNMKSWTELEIVDYYDANPNLTLADYAKNLGISVLALKRILMW